MAVRLFLVFKGQQEVSPSSFFKWLGLQEEYRHQSVPLICWIQPRSKKPSNWVDFVKAGVRWIKFINALKDIKRINGEAGHLVSLQHRATDEISSGASANLCRHSAQWKRRMERCCHHTEPVKEPTRSSSYTRPFTHSRTHVQVTYWAQ